MAQITNRQSITPSGVTVAYAAADVAGDTFVGRHGDRIRFRNTNAAVRNVTILSQVVDGEGFLPENKVVNVPLTTGDKEIRVDRAYINPTTGLVSMTYDAVVNLTVAWTD